MNAKANVNITAPDLLSLNLSNNELKLANKYKLIIIGYVSSLDILDENSVNKINVSFVGDLVYAKEEK